LCGDFVCVWLESQFACLADLRATDERNDLHLNCRPR